MSNSPSPHGRAPGDDHPQSTEPLFNLPGIVLAICIVLSLIQTVRELLPDETDFGLVTYLAFVPARFTLWFDPNRLDEVVTAAITRHTTGDIANRVQLIRLMISGYDRAPLSMLTYGLLHGSWVHLVSNLLWLAAFGTPVARRLGPARFVILMVFATFGGALVHWLAHDLSILPMVGASAAVAGAMAGATRFVFSPGFRFGGVATDAQARAIPAERILDLWRNGKAIGFIIIWFATNAAFGSGLIPIMGGEASIAWEAHVGGFLAGLLLFPLLDRGRVRPPA
jgi:membrane associated rhomboid family serine protease